MPASGPLKPIREDGTQVEATFRLSTMPVFEMVYEFKAAVAGSVKEIRAQAGQTVNPGVVLVVIE